MDEFTLEQVEKMTREDEWKIAKAFGKYIRESPPNFYENEKKLPYPKSIILFALVRLLVDENFKKLMEDIEHFERIEDEYISFILKEKNETSAKFLLENLGRPYESIYKAIIPNWIDADELSKKLELIIDNDPNPLIKLEAITAAIKAKALDKKNLRQITLKILDEFKNQLKTNQITDRWFVNHILYGSAINTLAHMGIAEDLPLIDEAINRETILDRTFFYYSYFHHEKSFERLLALLDVLKKEEERENAIFVLDSIDYEWTKELLGVKT